MAEGEDIKDDRGDIKPKQRGGIIKEHRPYNKREGSWYGPRHDHHRHYGGRGYYEQEPRHYYVYSSTDKRREKHYELERPRHHSKKSGGRGKSSRMHQSKHEHEHGDETTPSDVPTSVEKKTPSKVPTSVEEKTPSKVSEESEKVLTCHPVSLKTVEVIDKKTPHGSLDEGFRRKGKKVVSTPQSDELAQQLLAGTLECMVCYDHIRRRDEVWACGQCYHIFHLHCIQRWARSSAAAVSRGLPP